MKHLIPEFDKMKRRYPPGAESSLVLPCLHRIQDDRGFIADEDIAAVAVRALTSQQLDGQKIVLTGPHSLTAVFPKTTGIYVGDDVRVPPRAKCPCVHQKISGRDPHV